MPKTAAPDTSPIIVWFRQDLRLADNPALAGAAADGRPVIPLYILDDAGAGDWVMGGASRWWLHHSLASLGTALAGLGTPLVLRRGAARKILPALVAETGAIAVTWNRCYEPAAIERDKALKVLLGKAGVTVTSHNASLLNEPWEIRSKAGTPFRVFTPFWRACLAAPAPARPLPAPHRLTPVATQPDSERLDDWRLLPTRPDWAQGLRDTWQPGETGAVERLETFLDEAIGPYRDDRNRPDRAGTSMLSPHLHFGEISPRQIWHATHHATDARPRVAQGGDTFLSEIGWREFSCHLLFHEPTLPTRPLRPEFEDFPWARDDEALHRWQRGQTGYPIVDAGMRELWTTGWMHNRVRMIVASFLIKDLLLPWQAGTAWFWDTLVDADLASNSASWQWVGGCGADAAPYFRIFNPVLQGNKFDPRGDYVRRWVPELAALPDSAIHEPWKHMDDCRRNGIELGRDYPRPMVDHGKARERALAALATIKSRDAA